MPFSQEPEFAYSPTTPDNDPEDPALDEVIRQALDVVSLGLRVCMPAKVVAISGNQKVDLQPLLQSRYVTGAVVTLPVIKDALVSMPVGQNYSVKLPIAVGDNGLAVFCDRSLDVYAAGDGSQPVDPMDIRRHHLMDAIFLPGLATYGGQTTDATTDLALINGQAQVRLLANGKVQIQNGTQDLLSILDQLIGLLSTTLAVITTPSGPGTISPTDIQSLVQMKLSLDTLKV